MKDYDKIAEETANEFKAEVAAVNIQPCTDMQLSLDNWDLIRQWFNAVHDLNSDYLTQADIDLYETVQFHLQSFNYPLPAPRFVGAEIFSKAEQLKRTKAQLGSVGAELEEMRPERLHELLGNIPAASIPAPAMPLNKQRWGSNLPSKAETNWLSDAAMPLADTIKASAPAWYDYEQQKPVTAPHVGCEVIVMNRQRFHIMEGARVFLGKNSKVVATFENGNGVKMVTVELSNGECCCFVLEMIAPTDYDKPTFNKFSLAASKALNLQNPTNKALTSVLEKLYNAGFKAPEQSE